MESDQTIAALRTRSAETLQTATALPEGLEAAAPSSAASEGLVCPLCWAAAERSCTITGPAGDHLARYLAAEKAGLITRLELAAVVAGLEVIADHVIVRDGAR